MRIITLIENTLGENTNLVKEHGLSMFIETSEGNILFDTGQSGNFILNAEELNVDLDKIDYIVLSHAHYDHTGGIRPLLDLIHCKPKLYVSKYFFADSERYHINSSEEFNPKYIGINFHENYILNKGIPINYINESITPITSKAGIVTNFNENCDFETINESMKIKIHDKFYTDTFRDEIVITIDTDKGILVLLGCSHPGVVNIIDTIRKRTGRKIYGIIGGTHLIEADETQIDKTIDYLKSLDIQLIGVSHCTGKKALEKFKIRIDDLYVNYTGKIIKFE